ncbi:reticulocyte binding protein, putative, partial [Plasmodium yoelii]
MKKLIYITTTYIVLFTSLGVIYGKKIETGKKNHDGQLNNFYLYNNLKGINFNNSNSSNEEQYNNKNDVINDKFIQPNSITYLENQKDTANDKVILYNDYTNKNDLDTLKFFNNDNEKTNRKATIVKSAFIQNSNPTRFDSSMYNTIDILYNVSGPNENLKYFYVKLYFYQELRTFLNNIYSNAKKPVNIPRSTPLQIDNDINLIIKECELQKTNLINEMSKLHNPLYEFYKESTKDDYNPYSNYRKSYVDCMLPRFKKLEPKIDAAISSMQSEYDHLCYYEYWNVDALYKEYATTTKQYMDSQLDVISNHLVIHGMGISSHGNRLSKILESEGEQGSIISKLKFLSNEIECTLNKYSNYKNECTSNYTFMVNYVQHDTYRQYYYYYLREIKKIAQQRANFIYNFNKLKHLKLLYKQQEGIMRNFHKTIERLIFGKPDPNNTNVFKEYIYEFNISIPKSKLTALEKRFFEIFEEKWNSYEIKKDIDENSKQYNVVKLILQYMKELTDLIDFMDNYQPDEVPTRSIIGFEVEWRINQTLYTEVEAGVKKSYESVKNWRKSMVEINKKLEEENEKVIKLETQINDLFNQYLKINDENIYLNKLKLELKEKIKNISDKNEYVKKAVDLKKTIENNNIYIDELTKTSPYQVPEHLKNTDTIYNTIKLELSQIYEDDIDKLYNELSSIVQENDIDNVEDKTKLDDLQSKIDNVYSKIQNMENETVESHLTNIETNKNKLSDTILAIKKYIYGEISKDLNKTLEDFKNKEKELSNKINDYAKENDQLNVYKSKISEIRNHYNSQINIDNTKEGEAKQNYDKSNEHMTKISTNENEISKFINEVKSMKDAFLSKVDKYINFDNNYKENVNLEHTQFTELTDKIKAEVSDEKLSKHEKSFNDSKSLINETKNSIEKEYQNINTLKKVDEYIKVCEITKESITKFSSKQNTLKCMLNQNIKTVKETNSIENFYKDKFENTLTTKISTNENEISKFINEVKSMKDAFLSKVDKYINFDNNYKENVNLEHTQFTELTDKIKAEVSDEKLSKHEKSFNDSKSLINETKNSIEKEYQNINTLKKVDEYIKVCEITKESITKFSSKQNTLKCMLNQNIKTVKETNSIENFYKDKFENTLTNKINELDKTFKDASLNDYELNNNELMQYFNNLKENLGKDKENMLYNQLAEKEKTFNDIKKNNTHINEEISNIEIAIYASIYNISEEIKNEIGKNIELLNAKVVEKVKANVTNLNEIKEKLKHYNFHDFGKDENIKYANEVNKIKDDIKTVSQQIDHHINKLEDIKKKSGSYVGEMKEQIDKLEKVPDTAISNDTVEGIEKKQKIIVTKIDKNKNIYEEIDKLLSEISKIEKDQTSLEKVKGINLSYGQSLGNLFLEQIDEEKKKAEHTIKAMESYMEDLDNIKKKSQEIETEMDIKMDINQEMEALKISHDDDKKWDAKSKSYKKNISDIYDKSSKIIKDLSNESDINDIKNKLQKNVSESQKHNSEINQCLSEVANIYNILKLNKIKKIIDKVKEYTSEIEKNKKNINDELNNSGKVIKKIEDDLSLKECKSKIESTLDDKDIDKCIKNITNLKTYILSEETNIANHFKNAEEYNKNVLLNFHNIEMADNKSQYILKIKKNNDTSNHDYNIKELKEHKDKSNGYKTEADKNKKAIEKNKELFEKYKEEVTVLLNKYYAVELKNKFDKTKKGSEQIIKEIKETHNKFILELGKSKQKMNEIKNEQIHIGDEVANNDKSNKAIASIKISVEPFETKFLKINDIKKKSDEYLKETESIEKKLSNLSIDSQETKLKENEGKLNTLKELLESLKNQKKNIEDRKKELDE